MPSQRMGWLLLAPVVAAVVFSWLRLAFESGDVPGDDDYAAARAILEQHGFAPPRDALAILPPWSLRPLQSVGDLEPIAGDALADQPLHRYSRLWVIVEPDAADAVAALVQRRGAPAFSARAGRVVVERYDLPAASVSYDFRARLADAAVRVVGAAEGSSRRSAGAIPAAGSPGFADGVHAGAGGPRACDVELARGVSCGRESWQRVTREWALVSENGDDVIWAHPPSPAGARLELEWRDVPIGRSIVVRAGFTRDGADRARAPVRLRVLVDGTVVGTVTRRPAFSFHTDVIDTRRYAGGAAGTVTFAIDSDDNAGAHFAFDAYVVGDAGSAPP